MPRNLKSRTETKDTIVSLPVRVWHQVETFDDGSEVCAIKHPNGAIYFGANFPEALHNMKDALKP